MSGLQVYQAGGQGVVTAQFPPVQSPRDPTSADKVGTDGAPYNLLRQWINTTTKNSFTYLGSGVWVQVESSTGDLFTLSDTAGTIVNPASGNIQLSGTTAQITATAGANKITFSLPAAVTMPGSLTVTTKLNFATGANTSTGVSAAMSTGAVTVPNTSVTANSKILAYPAALGTVTVPQAYYISAIVAATSFTITSQDPTDTSTWNYVIIN